MTIAMVHRGPDEGGQLRAPGIALGMRRLSIIDLAGSHQPLGNEDGTISVAFNGEIFNFRELRRELARKGHRLASAGDTEALVHLYEDHGPDFVKRLRGMFAIALWDSRERRLLLARDRLGVKPLYYAHTPAGLAFASEIKCLLAAGLVTSGLDAEAAELFLGLGYVPGPRTLFAGVSKLAPATVLEWRGGRTFGPNPYWTPHDRPPFAIGSPEDDAEHLLELLRASVRARMVSDVPLGVMLSGGLDSSLIAALMAEASPSPISTFSVGFAEDGNANELAWARKTAARLGSEHHELTTSASEHDGLLDEALWHLEEPIADLSFLGFLLLSRLARENVTVALCGQAADELLAGYTKHRAARVADLAGAAPRVLTRSLATLASGIDERSNAARLLRTIATDDDVDRLLAMSQVITPALRSELGACAADGTDVRSLLQGSVAGFLPDTIGQSRVARTLSLDLRLALPDLMFLYFDKMSMATSLEVRVPFADHDVVTFCSALPDDRRIRRLRGKAILRRISRDLVEESIIERPKRGFFRAASSSWLRSRGALVRDTLLDRRCVERGLLDPRTVRRWIDDVGTDGRSGEPLLTVFLLERWHRHFVDSDGAAQAHAREARRAATTVADPLTVSR